MTNLRSARVVLSLYRSNLAGCYFAFSGRFWYILLGSWSVSLICKSC
jgi:hypothetical protein